MHVEFILGQEDTRRISGRYPEDIRRISGGYPEDVRRIQL